MRCLHAVVIGLVAVAVACSRDGAPRSSTVAAPSSSSPSSPPSGSAVTAPPRSVGVARMKADGTLELDLRGPGGAEARKVYPPTHAEYSKVLDHLGGMKPGDERPIPASPDPWDASKVEAAAHALAAKKGWKRDEYTIEIMGTDAADNAVVTLSRAGGKSVSIRVETKTYTVVNERGLP